LAVRIGSFWGFFYFPYQIETLKENEKKYFKEDKIKAKGKILIN